jgi:hypothetical protein
LVSNFIGEKPFIEIKADEIAIEWHNKLDPRNMDLKVIIDKENLINLKKFQRNN